ncbi:MAG: hypothetical protein CXZ00_03515 [Acidobacteria bacterium]|nr:MAG: hypothetical protein CXZ00_03515 [Acidobacteriota bacterium]
MAFIEKDCDYRAGEQGVGLTEMFTTDLSGHSVPSRALVCSVLVHGICMFASLYMPWSYWCPPQVRLITTKSFIQEHRDQEVLLLPALMPFDSEDGAAPSGSSGVSRKGDAASAQPGAASKAVYRVAYKGPQLIISNPPHPDNFIQTIRQPHLVKPPKLPTPLPLPPIVAIAPSRPLLAPAHPQPAAQAAAPQPIILRSQQLPVEAPKLPLSPANSAGTPLHAVADAPAGAAMPKLAVREQLPGKPNNETRNLLVVTAVPVPDRKITSIPPGELSGAFMVSPAPFESRSKATGLAGSGTGHAGASGSGHGTSGTGMGGAQGSGNGTGVGPGGSKSGTASGHGTGNKGTGPGSGRAGQGSGNQPRGIGTGLHGSGKGNGSGNGSGTSASLGNSPFAGITIQGGSSPGFSSPSVNAAKPQTSYGITIIASGSSGGGFRDFGVFRNEPAYTVYLDMADAGVSGPSWTLQYALYSVPNQHGLLIPPYAISKALPRLSPESARRNRGSMVVVYGVINPQGKFEDLRVMQSPDGELNPLLLQALQKWTFKPAEVEGTRVAVKVLLGVPVSTIPVE